MSSTNLSYMFNTDKNQIDVAETKHIGAFGFDS